MKGNCRMYYVPNLMDGDDASLSLCRAISEPMDEGKIRVEQPHSSLSNNPTYVVDVSKLEPVTLKVRLDSCGNPDYRQDPDRPLPGVIGGMAVVKTLEEAQSKCKAFIEFNDLGSGNWIGGHIFANDHVVAYVSYNGRLWTGETENFQGMVLRREQRLTDPMVQSVSTRHSS